MSSEMFGKYSAVFLRKISAVKYFMRYKRLSILLDCLLCQIIVCGPIG